MNGDRKVTDAKNNANQTLSTLDNLNNAQKGAVTGNINQAHTVAEVTQAIQTAQELNTAMGNLKNSLNDKDTTLGSQNFADADPEKKNAYNEAVRNAENILNKSTGTNVPKDQVEAAMNQVNTTKAALNGTQNLEKAKQHANTAIDGLSHLTNAQKEALKQLVQQSTTVAEAQGNEQKQTMLMQQWTNYVKVLQIMRQQNKTKIILIQVRIKRMRTIKLSQLHKVLLIKLQVQL